MSIKKKMKQYIKNIIFRHQKLESPKLMMTILVKNEIDIIEAHINYHRSLGIDHFIITDHNSTDGTYELLEKLSKVGDITLIRDYSITYNQVEMVDKMIKVATNLGADWVINSDADEFWVSSKKNFKSEFINTVSNTFFCNIYNVVPITEEHFYRNNLLIKNTPSNEILNTLPKYNIFSKQIPKVVHRTKGYKRIHGGNHNVDISRKNAIISNNIYIFHYSIRSKEHFYNKVMSGGKAIENTKGLSKKFGSHWTYYYNELKNGNLDIDTEYNRIIGLDYVDKLLDSNVISKDDTVLDFFEGGKV